MIKVFKKFKNENGFAILFSVTLAGILLAIALGVSNVALKELKFSTSNRFTNEAFFAADTGMECAFYNDRAASKSFLPPASGGTGVVNCLGKTITLLGEYPDFSFVVSELGNSGQSCAKVSVSKSENIENPELITTTVVSKGYNIGDSLCTSSNPNRIEREILVAYGGPASLPPPPPPGEYNLSISKDGVGTGTVTSNPAGISCGGTCSANFANGSSVSLTATPTAGFIFSGWSGSCGGSGICNLEMDDDHSAIATFGLSGGGEQEVTWKNTVGVSTRGNSLEKTSGGAGFDSGASSTQSITSGDGYIEFTASEISTYRFAGLSNNDTDQSYTSMRYSWYMANSGSVGSIYVMEYGQYGGYYTTFSPGDVFRISIESNTTRYYKNGVRVHTSGLPPTYPLVFDTSLYSQGSTVNNAKIFDN